jgi:hypothetical protein
MTYRDTEDALKARIQALESKLSQRAQERSELQTELAEARRDLAALHPPTEERPVTLLVLGVVGAALLLFGMAAYFLTPLIGYQAWLTQLPFGLGDVGLGLGLIGFYLVTRQRLLLVAAILLFVGVLDSLVRHFAAFSPWMAYPGWLLNVTQGLLIGVALLRAPEDKLRSWKRKLGGVLYLVGVFFGSLSFALFIAQVSFEADGAIRLFPYISVPNSLITVGKIVVLMLCFLELQKPSAAAR